MSVISYLKDNKGSFVVIDDNIVSLPFIQRSIVVAFIRCLLFVHRDADVVSIEGVKRDEEDLFIFINVDDIKLVGSFPMSLVINNGYDSSFLETVFYGINFQEV